MRCEDVTRSVLARISGKSVVIPEKIASTSEYCGSSLNFVLKFVRSQNPGETDYMLLSSTVVRSIKSVFNSIHAYHSFSVRFINYSKLFVSPRRLKKPVAEPLSLHLVIPTWCEHTVTWVNLYQHYPWAPANNEAPGFPFSHPSLKYKASVQIGQKKSQNNRTSDRKLASDRRPVWLSTLITQQAVLRVLTVYISPVRQDKG